jgi:hypothetical protein
LWEVRIITAEPRRWHSPAAYLYLLRLNRPSLAWEYLRRNTSYQEDWSRRQGADARDPLPHWQLEAFEDPSLDARVARPIWRLETERRVKLRAAEPGDEQEPFSLWTIPGPKQLVHDGRRLLLNAYPGRDALHLTLGQDVHDGEPFEYVLSPRPDMDEQWRRIQNQQRLLTEREFAVVAVSPRPDRVALLHMRALQALDASADGASQREIAASLFGEDSAAANWHPDSELRAQVRHLLRRARALMVDGYRSLIST